MLLGFVGWRETTAASLPEQVGSPSLSRFALLCLLGAWALALSFTKVRRRRATPTQELVLLQQG